MSRFYRMMKRDNKGFTLVELMVVLLILGILVAIVVPLYNNAQEKAADTAHAANIRTLEGAGQQYLAVEGAPDSNEVWTGTENEETWNSYVKEWPDVPAGQTKDGGATEYKVTIDTTGNVKVEAVIN